MGDAQAAKPVSGADPRNSLYERIGRFLDEHRLSPDPAHYHFAHAVLSAPDQPLAIAVARLTDGGVRLSRNDIERLGGQVVAGAPAAHRPASGQASEVAAETGVDSAISLVVETQHHVEDFTQIMRTMQDETRGFGRDLAKSAAAIKQIAEIDEITQITSMMIGRIHDSEVRLAAATAEADILRTKLVEAHDIARRDMLTGLPNRRAFEEAFAERDLDAGPYCLAVCDIDRFKGVNDLHGHGVGDRVLIAIGQALSSECAPHLVVRHGGEEFALLIKGKTLSDAAKLLDRVRATVAAKRYRNRETDAPLGSITFSAGITAIHIEETSGIAFSRADRLLYTAKEQGRDRICAA
ncbi:GGDEF domain-containing protein [Sphingomonas sp. PP-CE-1G-424]|uniref:GGDEF domain-containing protein n=1 Tax=Sphingomonas sp. PP-CE-1G-424 TaxID=2135658 RepID=UPI001056C5FB|nr:GGDEF domain-containing protein [Sphingomonas sp. PP-CE-1G-424]TCP72824.1 diguanylate cyclase [Sphingomonas sp. PP-CE-1G-424]